MLRRLLLSILLYTASLSFQNSVLVPPAGATSFCGSLITVKLQLTSEQIENGIKPGTPAILKKSFFHRAIETVFLGKMINEDGTREVAFFLEPSKKTIHYVDAKSTRFYSSEKNAVAPEQINLLVLNQPQDGGTCAAYAFYHCLRQISLQKTHSTPALDQLFSSSVARKDLLENAIDQIHVKLKGVKALNEMAEENSLKISTLTQTQVSEFKQAVSEKLAQGMPVFLRYFTGKDMRKQEFDLINHTQEKVYTLYSELWEPYRGDRFFYKPDRHVVVLLAEFHAMNKRYLLVSDSNWEFVRVWPYEFLDRANTAEMDAWVLNPR